MASTTGIEGNHSAPITIVVGCRILPAAGLPIGSATLGNGSNWDIDTSADEDESCLFNLDGTNEKIWILNRETLAIIDTFGYAGRSAGEIMDP